MILQEIHIPLKTETFNPLLLQKGVWVTILHAKRIPPHIGLIFSGNYNSLTIKDRETNINSEILLKTVNLKKIKSIFLKITPHPVFSVNHQLEIFQENLKNFTSVKQYETTCLSPIKLFFQEFYGISVNERELLFDFTQRLNSNNFIDSASALNLELNKGISLPFYTFEELNEKIKSERQPYYNN